jgi:hypothetical protein
MFELPTGLFADGLRLYHGELSEYHQQRITKSDLPNTLIERDVPVMTWAGTQTDAGPMQSVLSQAQAPLEPGETYTWALLGQGPLLAFQVGDLPASSLRRLWPPKAAGFWGYAAYCSDSAPLVAPLDTVFEPGARRVSLQRGLGLERVAQYECVHFEIADDPLPDVLVPPVTLGNTPLDPEPLRAQDSESVATVSCQANLQVLGPGCVDVRDDRIVVVSPPRPALWLIASDELQFHGVVEAGFTVRGFVPEQTRDLDFVAFLSDGRRYAGQARITTLPAAPHVVINEVLANPLGSEPGQEWVELYNDGSSGVDLGGWIVSDGTGESALPAFLLHPGEHVIVTSEQYQAEGSDVQLPQGVQTLRVPSLGANGLSNSGETLTLLSDSGQLQSRFPARTASKAGVSIARVSPEAPDDAEASFAVHGEPGASPGTANAF